MSKEKYKEFLAKIYPIFKNFFINHKIILWPLFLLSIVLVFVNGYVDKNTAYIPGETAFSFDYSGHIQNIIFDFKNNTSSLLHVNECLDCPIFYQYSKWFSIIFLSIYNLGSLLGFHPFIFYIFLTVSIRIIAVYIALYLFVKKIHWFPFLVASVVFIGIPVNFMYFGTGTLLAFDQSFLLVTLALIIYTLKNIERFSVKKIFALGLLSGLISSFFLNISISFLPLFLYSFLIILIFFYKKWINNWKKIISFSILIIGLMSIINLPVILSILFYGNSRIFFSYNKLNLLDSLTGGFTMIPQSLTGISPVFVIIFFFALFILILKHSFTRKQIFILASSYALIAILLCGDIFFDYIFHNFPLMNSFRAMHRMIIYEQLILVFLIYVGLSSLIYKKGKSLYLAIFLSIIFVGIPSYFVYSNWDYLNKILVPEEYFQVDKYFGDNNDKKIYFPSYMPIHQTISNNFSWTQNSAPHPSLFQNPFLSLFSLSNLITLEPYPNGSQKLMDMRALFDYRNDPKSIVQAMKDFEIKYLIMDKNFLWEKNFPLFDYTSVLNELTLEKSIGNIDIYKIPHSKYECKKSYGNYSYGYCHVEEEKPDYLLSINKEDYLIASYKPKKKDFFSINIDKRTNFYFGITDPQLQSYLTLNKIMYADLMTVEKNNPRNKLDFPDIQIFQKKVDSGKYKLIIPLMTVMREQIFFKDSFLEVRVNDQSILTLTPFGDINGLIYKIIPLDLEKESEITMWIKGPNGYLTLKKPFILERSKFDFIINIDEYWQPEIID